MVSPSRSSPSPRYGSGWTAIPHRSSRPTTWLRSGNASSKRSSSTVSQDALVADQNHKAHVASLKEAIRQLLLQAAYIELAQTANRGLFDEGEDLPLDFSNEAIRRLKRHKIPFAGALKLVDVSDMQPRPEEPKYIRLRDSYPDVLTRRFDATKVKLCETLGQLVQAQKTLATGLSISSANGDQLVSIVY